MSTAARSIFSVLIAHYIDDIDKGLIENKSRVLCLLLRSKTQCQNSPRTSAAAHHNIKAEAFASGSSAPHFSHVTEPPNHPLPPMLTVPSPSR